MNKWKSKVATKEIYCDGYNRVLYHGTPVVSFNHDNIVLDTGGWETVTTKKRMNEVSHMYKLGFSVYQKNNQWYVYYMGLTFIFTSDVVSFPRCHEEKETYAMKMRILHNDNNIIFGEA